MIMSGSTPRLVSLWGALGALSLGALLLPVNATWAQKPEENKEIRVIVKTDDSGKADKVTDAVDVAEVRVDNVTVNSPGEFFFVYDDAPKPGQDADKKSVVNVVVKTDDSSVSFTADSVDEAINKIKDQIKALASKAPLGDKEKSQQEALMRIAKQLEDLAPGGKKPKSADGTEKYYQNAKARYMVRELRDTNATPVTPEKKAQIEKARARISELSAALAAAQLDLANLEGHGMGGIRRAKIVVMPDGEKLGDVSARITQPKIAEQKIAIIRKRMEGLAASNAKAFAKKVDSKQTNREITIGTDDGLATGHELRVLKLPKPGTAEEDRIKALENKLNKLLEEVASLKKERSK